VTHRLREAALWTGAALGLLSVVAGTAVMFFGYTLLIFRSGSMEPDISTGSLALARTTPAADLQAGDVVSVLAANGERITHRVVTTTLRGDEATLVLQGDANNAPDQEVYVVTEAEREIASLPYLGYGVSVLLSPAGLVAVGCLSAMLVLMTFGGSDRGDRAGGSAPGGKHRSGDARSRGRRLVAGSLAAGVVAGAAVASVQVQGTSAFYADRASTVSGTFSMAGVVASPVTNVRCVPGLINNNAIIRWNAPVGTSPTAYRLNYTSNAASGFVVVDGETTEARPPVPTENGNRTYTVTVTAVYGSVLSPVSATSDTIIGRNSALFPWSC
jgi:signal peptidase I